jgi:ubiquinone/menaquinone biosynthesis C-methylase UbiE
MLEDYLNELRLRIEAAYSRSAAVRVQWPARLARRFQGSEVVGLDPGSLFIGRARSSAEGIDGLAFVTGDGRDLPFEDGSFDAVVCHTALCHIPQPERVLAEAMRVARPSGWLAVFDGDYATTTVAICDHDPLQTCADAAIAALVHDRWLIRRLPALMTAAGWQLVRTRSHGYVETTQAQYMLTLVDRGADALAAATSITKDTAEALKEEARRRVRAGTFFGHIAYGSVLAHNPDA